MWEVIGLKTNRTWDPHGSRIIVTVATRIRDNYFFSALRRIQLLCQFIYMNSRHIPETSTFPVVAESLDEIESQAEQQYPLNP